MNKLLEAKPHESSEISRYISQFEHTKLFTCVFNKESDLAKIINSIDCPKEDITCSFEQLPVDISEFFSGFVLTSEMFILISKTRAIGNVAETAAYTEFLSLIHHIKQKKLKHIDI
ncbi:hypothetical protein LMH73_012270 [Vibrio splendidus]|nr:hypothetical protein [Vibrio splendidus]MCC4880415.1 hypothetical protein [Vibrio splendidus]